MINYPEYPCCKCGNIDIAGCIGCNKKIAFDEEINFIRQLYNENISEYARNISMQIAEHERQEMRINQDKTRLNIMIEEFMKK